MNDMKSISERFSVFVSARNGEWESCHPYKSPGTWGMWRAWFKSRKVLLNMVKACEELRTSGYLTIPCERPGDFDKTWDGAYDNLNASRWIAKCKDGYVTGDLPVGAKRMLDESLIFDEGKS
jgi:hypothetical protein